MATHVNINNSAYKHCRFLSFLSGAAWTAAECFPCNSAAQCPARSGPLPQSVAGGRAVTGALESVAEHHFKRRNSGRLNRGRWRRGSAWDSARCPSPRPLHHPYPRTCHAVKRRDGEEKQEVRVITTLYETPGSITVIYEIVRVFTAAAEFYDSIRDFEELLNTNGSTSTSLCETPRGSRDIPDSGCQ